MAAITGKTVVITGANRGIGLEFARQLVAKDNTVVAAIRTPTSELDQLKQQSGDKLIVTSLDVSQPASITEWAKALPKQLGSRRVDVLINNAGMYGPNPGVLEVTAEDILSVFHTNTLAPLLVTQQLIKAGLMGNSSSPSLVGNVTSKMGSISDNTSGRCYPYRCIHQQLPSSGLQRAGWAVGLDHFWEQMHTQTCMAQKQLHATGRRAWSIPPVHMLSGRSSATGPQPPLLLPVPPYYGRQHPHQGCSGAAQPWSGDAAVCAVPVCWQVQQGGPQHHHQEHVH
jgi:hypothetical protein